MSSTAAPPRHPARSALARLAPGGVPVLRAGVRRTLTRMFGPPPIQADAEPGDPGLTGPGSPSWRVIGEPAAIAGGLRGLLVQVSHPLAMAGVADHSAFREDPLGRLQRTSAYVTVTTFGSTREALVISRRVRAVHPRVVGTAPDGRDYRADDPRLLTWVAVALTSSFLAADRLWAPMPVVGPDADRFVLEQSRIAALLDPRVDLDGLLADETAQQELREGRVPLPMLDDGTLPRTAAELDAVLATYDAELGVNHQGRDALHFLAAPPIPRSARAGYRVLLAGAIGSLTRVQQRALELTRPAPRNRRAVARTGAALTLMRMSTGTSPTMAAATSRVTPAPGRYGAPVDANGSSSCHAP